MTLTWQNELRSLRLGKGFDFPTLARRAFVEEACVTDAERKGKASPATLAALGLALSKRLLPPVPPGVEGPRPECRGCGWRISPKECGVWKDSAVGMLGPGLEIDGICRARREEEAG